MVTSFTSESAIDRALDACGFHGYSPTRGLSFKRLFGFEPNEMQRAFMEKAVTPGVHILEAPMGLGKTEAALYASYQMLCAGGLSGLYFALPTQATANQMLDRVNKFLGKFLDKYAHSVAKLSHGAAGVIQDFGAAGAPGGSWFSSPKNALLVPFGVGTVDQALLACMYTRFSGVRAFAMTKKVLVVDEVHSYDLYTGTFLSHLIKFVRDTGGSVILLSATLTDDAVRQLTGILPSCRAYPRYVGSGSELGSVGLPCGVPDKLITLSQGTLEEAEELAVADARAGAQVLFILNTVDEAVASYRKLASQLGADRVGLLHSRFTKADRQRNEAHWCGIYGKGGDRSVGRVLVGTQVLEQSLDLDADVMYSFLCPTDMLFQRTGRLHRHQNVRPVGYESPSLYLIVPDAFVYGLEDAGIEDKKLQKSLGGTGWVYDLYTLIRTYELWSSLAQVSVPEDMRDMLEGTYL